MNKTKLTAALMLAGFSSMTAQAEDFTFSTKTNTNAATLVLFQGKDKAVYSLNTLPKATQTHVKRALKAGDFKGDEGQIIELLAPQGVDAQRLLVVGVGDGELNVGEINALGGSIASHLAAKSSHDVTIYSQALPQSGQFAAELAHGIELKSYRFSRYKDQSIDSKDYQLLTQDAKQAMTRHKALRAVEEGVFLARDMTNTTAEHMHPDEFAKQALALKEYGVEVKVLQGEALEKMGMGALIGVGQGSLRKSRLVVAHWQGSDETPIALVGKGITFDSGGYNIKAVGNSIAHMKSDMAGAAAVLGTVKAMALQKAPVNVVAVMPLAENMISEFAIRPGDVLRTAEGKTVEITNTDAEGRLILADGLWYAREFYNPQLIVDVATLTGSKVRAIGREYTGLFSDVPQLVSSLSYAGEQVGEPLWRLPLAKAYGDQLKSEIADLRNTGESAGASVAAMFLKEFVGETPWAHLDIAGDALSHQGTEVSAPGATGHGVRLLSHWLTDSELKADYAGL